MDNTINGYKLSFFQGEVITIFFLPPAINLNINNG
jgi:hypothetical protein